MELHIATPITLKCGLTLPNRLVKAAMAERFADKDLLPGSKECLGAYREWAKGGWGLVITGNVQVDPAYLGGAGDFAVDCSVPKAKTVAAWKAWAEACSQNGTKAIVQINHPGRQSPFTKGLAPSPIPLDLGKGIMPWIVNSLVFGTPREMTVKDVQDVVKKFADTARLSAEAGFAGVEIHAAHGYLLAQFLSSKSNKRTDVYGRSALARAKIVVEIIHAIRAVVPSSFCVGIKLNSVDHQSSTDMSACIEQLRAITNAGVDFLEISGGSFENPTFNTGSPVEKDTAMDHHLATEKSPIIETKASTAAREAFFIEFANAIRSECPQIPLIVTGGFRTRQGMEAAVLGNSCDLVGLARPAVLNPMLPCEVLLKSDVPEHEAIAYAKKIEPWRFAKYLGIKAVGTGAETSWYTNQIHRIGAVQGSILVTGTNGGLGSSIVNRILHEPDLAKNYCGLYTVRNPESAANIHQVLEKAESVQHAHQLLPIDLASLSSVRKTAEDINKRVASGSLVPIRALILNAGWQEQTTQTLSDDGFDMSFQCNYLSHFLLTLMLLRSMDKKCGRIVVLSSWTHDTTHPNNKLGDFTNMYASEKYQQIFNNTDGTENVARGRWSSEKEHPGDLNAGIRRYGAAKLCEVMMFRELSARLANDPELSGISILALDPAAMPSELTRRDSWVRRVLIGKIVLGTVASLGVLMQPNGAFRTTWKSAGDVLRAAFDSKSLGHHPSGLYLNGSEVAEVGPEAKDARKTGQVWRDSLGYAQVKEGDTLLADWR